MPEPHPDEVKINNQRLISAARSDNEELLLEVFEHPGSFDINYQDGLGNTALHYAAQYASTTVLERLLMHEGCDVDLQNRMGRDTPLHAALKNLSSSPEARNYVIEMLLEAGSNTKIKDGNGDRPIDLVSSSSRSHDDRLRAAFRKAEAEASISQDDIAHDDDDDDGSDSGSNGA